MTAAAVRREARTTMTAAAVRMEVHTTTSEGRLLLRCRRRTRPRLWTAVGACLLLSLRRSSTGHR